MITKYFRPKSLEEALALLKDPFNRPLGGGSHLTLLQDEDFCVVDLQNLGLNKIIKKGEKLEIGATAKLQEIFESDLVPAFLKDAILAEAPINIRNIGTIAGTLLSSNGRSSLACSMLAIDAKCIMTGGQETIIPLGELLSLKKDLLPNMLILGFEIPLNVNFVFDQIGRTPRDKPVISISLAKWNAGRWRLVVGGWGDTPTLLFDGNEQVGLVDAAKSIINYATDEWGSGEYRAEMAGILTQRCLKRLSE